MAVEPPPHRLFPFRVLFLNLYLLFCGAIIFLMTADTAGFGVQFPFTPIFIAVAIIAGLQMLFLMGAPHLQPQRAEGGRPMMVSLAIGGLVMGLLTAGMVAVFFSAHHIDGEFFGHQGADRMLLILLGCTLVSWMAWLVIFTFILVGEWADRYRRLYRLLLAGTLLELIITIPVDVSVRKRTQCYCEEGTFWALLAGLVSLVWVLGPGIVMLFLARRMQRRVRFGYCRRCGYDLRMLTTPRCPECGTGFESSAEGSIPAA